MRASAGRPTRAGRRLAPALGATALLLAALELAPRIGLLPERSFPTSSAVLAEAAVALGDGGFWADVWDTAAAWAGGLGIAIAAAVPLGLLIGRVEALYHALRFPIEFLRPIPSVALVPLAVVLLGTGVEMKVFLAAFACFWILLFQTIYGVHAAEPVALDTARAYGLSGMQTLRYVVLPGAGPYIATGVRIAASVALILAVTAEIVVGSPGIGQAIEVARNGRAIEKMYALILITGALGVIINKGVMAVEGRLLGWHASHRPGELT